MIDIIDYSQFSLPYCYHMCYLELCVNTPIATNPFETIFIQLFISVFLFIKVEMLQYRINLTYLIKNTLL